MIPEPDPPQKLSPVYISRLRVSGIEQPIAELGAAEVRHLELGPYENQVNLDFFGLNFASGERLRYQYRLEGADRDWSPLSPDRSVNYARLAPGRYRFIVRAVAADGATSVPASMTFTILRPVWLRWWFLSLAVATGILLLYAAYRYRVNRLLEVVRVRTRIATDLHDDLGASLSRVAILTEVVKQRLGNANHESVPLLTEIADSARDLVASLRDIVWAIDTRRSDLADLVSRVRHFASTVLDARAVEWHLNAPPETLRISVDPEQRRHVFLFFKEAIHNIARHADCRSVHLGISVSDSQLICVVRDDGRGFSVSQGETASDGHAGRGLRNMHARAVQLGGQFTAQSSPGEGTHLEMNVTGETAIESGMNMLCAGKGVFVTVRPLP